MPPTYEFIGPHGERIERRVRTGVRDVVARGRRYHRAPVQAFAVVGMRGQPDQKDEVFRGYYREELKHGARFPSKYSKETIKRAWEKPCPNLPDCHG